LHARDGGELYTSLLVTRVALGPRPPVPFAANYRCRHRLQEVEPSSPAPFWANAPPRDRSTFAHGHGTGGTMPMCLLSSVRAPCIPVVQLPALAILCSNTNDAACFLDEPRRHACINHPAPSMARARVTYMAPRTSVEWRHPRGHWICSLGRGRGRSVPVLWGGPPCNPFFKLRNRVPPIIWLLAGRARSDVPMGPGDEDREAANILTTAH